MSAPLAKRIPEERHGFAAPLRTTEGYWGAISGALATAHTRGAARLRRDAPNDWGVWGAISGPPISKSRRWQGEEEAGAAR